MVAGLNVYIRSSETAALLSHCFWFSKNVHTEYKCNVVVSGVIHALCAAPSEVGSQKFQRYSQERTMEWLKKKVHIDHWAAYAHIILYCSGFQPLSVPVPPTECYSIPPTECYSVPPTECYSVPPTECYSARRTPEVPPHVHFTSRPLVSWLFSSTPCG